MEGDYHGDIHYLDLVKKARSQQATLIKDTEKRIKNLFSDVARELGKIVKGSKEGSLQKRWAKDYQKQIKDFLREMNKKEYDLLKKGVEKSCENGVYIQKGLFDLLNEKYSLDLDKRFSTMFSRIPKEALEELLTGKIYNDGRGLSKRIWQHSSNFEKDIGYIIEKEILVKRTAIELALDLEKYVDPDQKTYYNWSNCYPNLASKKCSYEAQRLARTS